MTAHTVADDRGPTLSTEQLRGILDESRHAASAGSWEARHTVGGATGEPLLFGVISHSTGKEVCRVWERDDAAYIASLPPAVVQSILTELLAYREREGWRWVPVEPTPAMVAAGYRANPEAINAAFDPAYRAMLAAVPSPTNPKD